MSGLGRLYRGENDIDFTRWWRIGMAASAVLIVLSVGSFFLRGFNLGIDFRGGVSWQVKAPGVTVEQTREAMRPLGFGEAKIQTISNGDVRVQASAEDAETRDKVKNALGELAGVDPAEVNVQQVGASWGGELTSSSLRALIVFMLAVFAYLAWRLEWKMAAGAIVAVVHDVLVSVGAYSIFQFEVTPSTVIAFLTILGFSIYDTVVVFDKVQENTGRVGLSSKLTYTEMMSVSMNQVLLRSLNTSLVGLLPVLAMLVVGAGLLGATTLEEFAIALAVGLLAGAYSSLFIAAPVVVLIKEREPRNRQLRDRLGAGKPLTPAAMTSRLEGLPADATGVPKRSTTTVAGARSATTTATATKDGPATSYSGAIPPRPRKKGKKR